MNRKRAIILPFICIFIFTGCGSGAVRTGKSGGASESAVTKAAVTSKTAVTTAAVTGENAITTAAVSEASAVSDTPPAALEDAGAGHTGQDNTERVSAYILPDSANKIYSLDELKTLSAVQMAFARNEIYARHGLIFDTKLYTDYFSAKDWYAPTKNTVADSELNAYEKANIALIRNLEAESAPAETNPQPSAPAGQTVNGATLYLNRYRMTINYQPVTDDTLVYNGALYLPINKAANKLALNAGYDAATDTTSLTSYDTDYKITAAPRAVVYPSPRTVKNATIYIDKGKLTINGTPRGGTLLYDNILYYPVDSLSETLDYKVNTDDASHTASLFSMRQKNITHNWKDPVSNTVCGLNFTMNEGEYFYYRSVDHENYLYKYDYNGFVDVNETISDFAAQLSAYFAQKGYSDWDQLQGVVGFCQSFDYISDETSASVDDYAKFPYETLYDNGGDCEDTAILLAKILEQMDYSVVLLEFPTHMMVGLDCGCPEGKYVDSKGRSYYFIETTNAYSKIGELPSRYNNSSCYALPVHIGNKTASPDDGGQAAKPTAAPDRTDAVYDANLCVAGESVLFSFKVADSQKTLSLCAADNGDYMVYRFGTRDNIELEYPGDRTDSWSQFTLSVSYSDDPDDTGTDHLSFQNKGYLYEIYQAYTNMLTSAIGVKVTNLATGKVTDIKGDSGSMIGNLDTLWGNSKINLEPGN